MKRELAERVKKTVEALVQGTDDELSPQKVYEACVNAILRLVFFRCAEQRGMLVDPDLFVDEKFAVDTQAVFSNLVRQDEPLDVEFPGQVYETLLDYSLTREDGAFVVTPSPNRRKMGTHYTPRPLADEIVCATLEPLVYDGFSDGKPLAECRLKRPEEILALKICDPAMGGGAFLLAACRWLSNRLLESLESYNENSLPTEREATELVAKNCLYGVDTDPLAVDIAKHSLCLLAHSMELPEANFRHGDSLTLRRQEEFPDVFSRHNPGFDAVLGNPPFMGGRKMRGVLGEASLRRLKREWPHASWNADLCAFFFLRAATIVRSGGAIGFLATKTVAQGDTARTGLFHLARTGFCVRQAASSFSWPGSATVNAIWTVLQHGQWNGPKILDGQQVDNISPILDEGGDWDSATIIPQNTEINFQGSVLAGEGFVLSPEEAQDYITARKNNAEALFPYLGGSEVNSSPTFAVRRWVIDFRDRPLEECEARWPELFDRIRRLVKPVRDKSRRAAHRRFWWHHGDKRPTLYERIRKNEHVFVLTRHTKYLALARVSTRQVFQESLCVLDLPDWTAFAAIQSTLHEIWARRGSSTIGEGLRYTPSDYFDTFPFLQLRSNELEATGKTYYEHRQSIILEFGGGLTDVYNRFHLPSEKNKRLEELRNLRRRLDEAVAATYGWNDLALNHDFHAVGYLPTNNRIRFTIDEKVRYEILRRFFLLNQKRAATGMFISPDV